MTKTTDERIIQNLQFEIDRLNNRLSVSVKRNQLGLQLAYVEVGLLVQWEQEDIDYSREAEREKWLGRGY